MADNVVDYPDTTGDNKDGDVSNEDYWEIMYRWTQSLVTPMTFHSNTYPDYTMGLNGEPSKQRWLLRVKKYGEDHPEREYQNLVDDFIAEQYNLLTPVQLLRTKATLLRINEDPELTEMRENVRNDPTNEEAVQKLEAAIMNITLQAEMGDDVVSEIVDMTNNNTVVVEDYYDIVVKDDSTTTTPTTTTSTSIVDLESQFNCEKLNPEDYSDAEEEANMTETFIRNVDNEDLSTDEESDINRFGTAFINLYNGEEDSDKEEDPDPRGDVLWTTARNLANRDSSDEEEYHDTQEDVDFRNEMTEVD